ncbi:MAG: hypothetical protein ACK4ZY_06235 [Sphingomonas sp.]
MSGIWVNDFESSMFFDGARRVEETRHRRGDLWFDIDDKTKVPRNFRRLYGHAYRVTFVGWRAPDVSATNQPEGYGHLNRWQKLVLADRILSMEDLGPYRPDS